jgi:leucyl aminopeptidase (aminopeptidase T)
MDETATDDALAAAARTAVEQCMGLDTAETCVVVTDDERERIGAVLYDVARTVADDATVARYPPGQAHGEEPPAPVAAAMREADLALAPTTKSLTHTRARSRATEAGARVATLPGITESVFTTGLAADYDAIAAACDDLYEQVAGAEEIRVTAPAGTDLTVTVGEREWRRDTGVLREAGVTNLPAGETFVSPESAEGTYVVDGTVSPYGLLAEGQPVRFTVEDGRVVDVDDPEARDLFESAAGTADRDAVYNLAELGIGANTAVTDLVGSILLDEKAAGTVHVAVGDDMGIGGNVDAPIHEDGVLRNPTVYADGEELTLPTA